MRLGAVLDAVVKLKTTKNKSKVFHFPYHPQEISLTNIDIPVLILTYVIIDDWEKRNVSHQLQKLKTN